MQGLATAIGTGSITYYPFRNHNLKKYVKPTRVSFSNLGSFPKPNLSVSSSSQRQIVPLLAKEPVDFASFGLPSLSRRNQRRSTITQVYKDGNYYSRKKPSKTEYERPEWWWRFLSCLPYLLSLKMSKTWPCFSPFLLQHGINSSIIADMMINLIPGDANQSQHYLYMVYCALGDHWVVKNRDLPHFFRFHMILGMFLGAALELVWQTSEFFPLINSNGKLRMYHGMVMGLSYLIVLLECLRCAICGIYPRIPFLSNAAYISTRSSLRDFGSL